MKTTLCNTLILFFFHLCSTNSFAQSDAQPLRSQHIPESRFQITFVHGIWIYVIQCCFTNGERPEIVHNLIPDDELRYQPRSFFTGEPIHLLQIACHLIEQVFSEEQAQKCQGSFRYSVGLFQVLNAHVELSTERGILFPK